MIEDQQGRGAEPSRPHDDQRPDPPTSVPGDPELDAADLALIDELRNAAAYLDPVPEETVLAARSMFAYLRLDAALAELTFDSLTDAAPVAVRSQAVAARQLSFDAGEYQIELEVVREAGQCRLVGQCVPATEVEVTVHRQDGVGAPTTHMEARITTDDLGRFAIDVSPGTLSLHCRWPSADARVATAWVDV
jgi:pectin methylesterase-like acyl-CoA thioesterase